MSKIRPWLVPLLFIVLGAVACNTDEPAQVGNNENNTTTNNSTSNNVTTGNNTTPGNNMTTVNNMSTGNNATTPPATPFPTTFVMTNGGGSAQSAEHRVQLTIGSPQPFGQASDGSNKLIVGPIVPVTGN